MTDDIIESSSYTPPVFSLNVDLVAVVIESNVTP